MSAVQDYCEDQGYLNKGAERPKPDPLKNVRILMSTLSDAELSSLLAGLQQLEETEVPSEQILEVLERVLILTRCDRIFPDL
ncbi:hypothetical protein GCM10011517_05600 [Actibacterium pelagium]|uniref:Uncharacterized protein n=2 Tax=Actibacterium pelagium TaxID=2029103 RepID=A0A917ACR7_9RHOB|nr:hypothetical protein GCM10011517_05600 [Actibacterium pelagium]